MKRMHLILVLACMLGIWAPAAATARPELPEPACAPASWGAPITWEGVHTTYPVHRQNFVYGSAAFKITDTRTDSQHSDKESYETRSLTVYRASDGAALFEHRPVVFFVHGGAWTDGYENWYDFVAQSFTGEKGWVTVILDYRLTSNQVFLADAFCPDRAHCDTAHAAKAAWYPDNIQDVAAAFDWVTRNISANGGDRHNLFLFGHSAGGHLASLLVTHPDYATLRPAVRGIISMSGVYALKNLNMLAFGSDIDQTFHGGHVNNDAELDAASPATYVVAGIALPPYYLLHAQQELPSLDEQTLGFRNRLAALGLPVSYAYLTGYSHTTEMEAIADVIAPPTALIVAFIEGILAQPQKTYLPAVRK